VKGKFYHCSTFLVLNDFWSILHVHDIHAMSLKLPAALQVVCAAVLKLLEEHSYGYLLG
jgi:hypothetical protein